MDNSPTTHRHKWIQMTHNCDHLAVNIPVPPCVRRSLTALKTMPASVWSAAQAIRALLRAGHTHCMYACVFAWQAQTSHAAVVQTDCGRPTGHSSGMIPVLVDAMPDWYHMFDYLADGDLMTDAAAELSISSCIRRKQLDVWAVHCSQRMIRIIGFTRCNDFRLDWRKTTEQYKSVRDQPLRDKMTELLPPSWSVEIVNFTVGISDSLAETS
jgi:hypothetical protein